MSASAALAASPGSSRLRRLTAVIAGVASAAIMLTGLTGTPAHAARTAPAAAADGCWGSGPVVVDPRGARWQTTYCRTYRAGDVYNYVNGSWQPIGRLNAGDNWFACQSHGPENPPVGDWANDIWLYTEADTFWETGGWGGFPATHVTGGENYGPIPNLAWCPWENTLAAHGAPTSSGK
ncbi:hypothetical protein Ssi03_31280 [Sphaerisporangium siamense]|uniref:Uncharacterized protein n=1 Tax=Sphaerisporangium siamense TaxID=795645 RepID=A0A7W7DEF6_9ACTN|nr:hypothetical protein [Sphaerisporangium siamense]MBB4704181.1 hypothetical protein [Sphaerisporangium siamense]GII85138.1 hypothetical protein Ssi03_31280 [Sphaerisporangium siamense]